MAVTSPDRSTAAAVRWAALVSGAMIVFQVASKATRDALFLSNFDVTSLPAMMTAAATISIVTALGASRAMTRFGPGRVVPVLFVASALLQMLEFALVEQFRRPVAVGVYLHYNAIGALLISGFWSVINERFDPRTAKRVVGPVGAAGTLGGLLGGLLAERVAAAGTVVAMLPLLGIVHLVCAAMVLNVHGARGFRRQPAEPRPAADVPARSGVRILANTPYLRLLVALVVLATVAEGALDYVFKFEAKAAFGRGPELLRVFAVFYAGVSLLSFAAQSLLSRRALERIGLARTAGSLPWTVAVGGGFALAAPGLVGAALARGAEAVARNSLYRASYELLFTPLPPAEKRATKPLVDVGLVRVGDMVAAGLVQAAIVVVPHAANTVLLILAVVAAAAGIALTFDLHAGYVATLERSLVNRAVLLDLDDVADDTTRTTMMHTIGFVGSGAVPISALVEAAGGTPAAGEPAAADSAGAATAAAAGSAPTRPLDPLLARVLELRSLDVARVRAALEAPVDATTAGHVIPLQARDDVAKDALAALRAAAPAITGQLADALLDPEQDFAVRRRVPSALVAAGTERALFALLQGLEDRRFEVRFRCGRALARLTRAHPELIAPQDRVVAAVLREAAVDREVWQSQRLLDQPDDDEAAFADAVIRDRASRSLEHVFTMLALFLPRQALEIAFRALHSGDTQLHGTALEYLETSLPAAVRDKLWPFLDDRPGRRQRPARSREEIVAELLESRGDLGRPSDPRHRPSGG